MLSIKGQARLLLLVLCGVFAQAHAQPDLSQRIGRTVADAPPAGWRIDDVRLRSADGERAYRVRLLVPERAPPAAGFPVLWMLDGNAVLMTLDAQLLGRVAASAQPPVIALIGYDNDLRIDAAARSLDYTPARPGEDPATARDPLSPERRSGGADAFLSLITGKIRPAVAERVHIDPARQTLWGHSYGGVFVLHALFSQPAAFQQYIAVEPSLWWGEGQLVRESEAFVAVAPRLGATRLYLWNGIPPADAPKRSRPGRGAAPPDTLPNLVRSLGTVSGLQVETRQWAGLGHGPMLGATVAPAIETVTGPLPDAEPH